jgi:phenylacetate-CoA ligase
MDHLTVRVEARAGIPAERRITAAEELVRGVKEGVGVTIETVVLDPETLERSMGKLQRVADERGRSR